MNHLLVLCAISLSIFTLASSPNIDAAIYKWTDDKGQVNYSSSTPLGVTTDNIEKKIVQVSQPLNQTTQKASDEQEKSDVPSSHQKETNSDKTNGYCKQQKEIAETLTNNPYIKWKVGDQEVLLEGAKKDTKIKEIQQDIQKYCGSAQNSPTI